MPKKLKEKGLTVYGHSGRTFQTWKSIKEESQIRSREYTANRIVGFCDEISIDLIIDFLACSAAGGIPVFLSHPSSKTSNSLFCARVANWRRLGIGSFRSSFISESSSTEVIENKNKISFIQLSSGTTNSQKGFGFSLQTVRKNVELYSKHLGLTQDSTIVNWLPLYHDMGLFTSLLMPMEVGCSSVIIPTFEWLSHTELLFDAIDEFSADFSWMPNFAFELLSKKDPYDLKNKKVKFINCSEKCRIKSVEKFSKLYGEVEACYAMAENVFAISQGKPGASHNEIMSVGVPFAADVRLNESGEILIRGDCLFDATLKDGKLLPNDKHQWYNTGDLGEFEGEFGNGTLYVVGRTKETADVFGRQIFLPDIDYEVSKIDTVKDGRVVSFSVDGKSGTKIVVLYESEDELDKISKNRKRIKDLFDIAPAMFRVPAGTLIKTSSGKFCRHKNVVIYEFCKEYLKLAREYTEENIRLDTNLKDEGILDSFEIMELLGNLAIKLGKSIDWKYDFNKLISPWAFWEALI